MNEAALAEGDIGQAVHDQAGQYLTFQLAGEVYAINILDIREIIEFGNLTAVPMTPSFIGGVINLRGSVVPVVNLAIRFGEEATKTTKRTSIIIVEVGDAEDKAEMGVIVDAVNEVLEIEADQIVPPPAFGASIRTDFISGMGRVGGSLMILLEVDHVLSIDELSEVAELGTEITATEQSDTDTVATEIQPDPG